MLQHALHKTAKHGRGAWHAFISSFVCKESGWRVPVAALCCAVQAQEASSQGLVLALVMGTALTVALTSAPGFWLSSMGTDMQDAQLVGLASDFLMIR